MDTDRAAAALIQWRPLLHKVCNRWARSYPWLADEFASDAVYALWRDLMKPGRTPEQYTPALVATIARRAVWTRIRAEMRRHRRRSVSAEGVGILAGEIDHDARLDGAAMFERMPADRRAEVYAHLAGHPLREPAVRAGVTTQAVQQRIPAAIRRVRESLSPTEFLT